MLPRPPKLEMAWMESEDCLSTGSTRAWAGPDGGGGGAMQHPLVAWFDAEVRPELSEVSRKLDRLLARASEGGSRKATAVGSTWTSEDEGCRVLPARGSGGMRRSATSHVSRMSSGTAPGGALGLVLRSAPDSSHQLEGRRGSPEVVRGTQDTVQVVPAGGQSENQVASIALPSARKPRSRALERHSTLDSVSVHKDVAKAQVLNRFRRRGLRSFETVWKLMDDPESSLAARRCAIAMPLYIILTVCVPLMQLSKPARLHGVASAVIETTIDFFYLCEFLVRLVVCPNKSTFLLSGFNLIDLAAGAPLALRASVGFVLPSGEISSVRMGVLLCAVPVIRVLKLLRRFEKLHLLLKAFELVAEALPVLLFMLSVIDLVFSMLIYLVEPRDNIPYLSTAVWLTTVTMTTVGYGDVTPVSNAGMLITGVLVVITVLYMAIPIGIIGNAFTVTWSARDQLLLMQRTRDRLRQWGYTAHDIPVLFRLSGVDDDGELSVSEFRDLLRSMQIGFTDERIFQLFSSFDHDRSGKIDDRKFVRSLFPNAYHEIYDEDSWG